jgi:N6-adenosine-specific RNA methylase IME4
MKYRCILAGPPWSYNNKSIRGSAQNHYTTLHLVLARRGLAMRNRKDLLNIIMDKRGPHSQKPLRAYQLIERFCDGPRLELFAREKQSGWDCWGDEIKSDINLGVMGKWPRN